VTVINPEEPEGSHFASREITIGGLGFAKLTGSRENSAENPLANGIAIVNGIIVKKSAQEFEEDGLYEAGISMRGAPREEEVQIGLHIPGYDVTLETICKVEDIDDDLEENTLAKYFGTTHDDPWKEKGGDEQYLLYASPDADILSQFEFTFGLLPEKNVKKE